MGKATGGTSAPSLKWHYHHLFYLVIGIVLVVIDPFGINRITEVASQDILYRTVIGPTYPGNAADPFGQPSTVLLLDDRFLSAAGVTWPIDASLYALILAKLRQLKPKAVMLDITFADERSSPGIPDLRGEISRYASSGIPLLFARAPTLPAGIRSDLAAPVDEAQPILVDVSTRAPDGSARTYPTKSDLDGLETAAFWLYRNLPPEPTSHSRSRANDDPPNVPMDIVWANQFQELNDRWMKGGCKRIQGISLSRIFKGLIGIEKLIQTCPYTATVPVSVLLFNPDDDLTNLVSDKVIFLGTSLSGTGDSAVVPTHGFLPGVYQHAMAYDNLVTYKGNYKKSQIGPVGRTNLQIIGSLVIVVITLSFSRWIKNRARKKSNRKSRKKGRQGDTAWWLMFAGLNLTITIAVSLALFYWADLSPANWLGLLGLALTIGILARNNAVESFLALMFRKYVPRLDGALFEGDKRHRKHDE